jgi:hypothetical protein
LSTAADFKLRHYQTFKASGSIVGLVEGIAGATQNVVQGFSGSLSAGFKGESRWRWRAMRSRRWAGP